MNRTYQSMLLALALVAGATGAKAHTEMLPILQQTTDVRSAAMGGVLLQNSAQSHLYSTPDALFHGEVRHHAAYSLSLTPKKTESGRRYFHNFSYGYRLAPKHALFAGFRLADGYTLPIIDHHGTNYGQVTARDFTLDLGYAYRINDNLSAFANAGYLHSYNGFTAKSARISIGLSYNDSIAAWAGGHYGVALLARDFGTKYKYSGTFSSNSLPNALTLSAHAGRDLSLGHHLQLAAQMNYYSSAKSFQQGWATHLGAEYEAAGIGAVRLGTILTTDSSVATLGLARRFGAFQVDAAYSLHQRSQFNVFSIGISTQF